MANFCFGHWFSSHKVQIVTSLRNFTVTFATHFQFLFNLYRCKLKTYMYNFHVVSEGQIHRLLHGNPSRRWTRQSAISIQFRYLLQKISYLPVYYLENSEWPIVEKLIQLSTTSMLSVKANSAIYLSEIILEVTGLLPSSISDGGSPFQKFITFTR